MQNGPLTILLLSGSPDSSSSCSRLLQHIKLIAGEQVLLIDAGRLALPVFSGSSTAGNSKLLKPLFSALKKADAVLLANPEHNDSISTYLKNILDHTSIPYDCNHWLAKPAGLICSAEHSKPSNCARDEILRLLRYIGADDDTTDAIWVGRARSLFDANGLLVEPTIKKQLQQLLDQLTAKIASRRAVRPQPPEYGIPLWNSWYLPRPWAVLSGMVKDRNGALHAPSSRSGGMERAGQSARRYGFNRIDNTCAGLLIIV